MADELPRGIRDNNPGNVDAGKVHWQGQVLPGVDPRFMTFRSMPYGVRCSGVILLGYQREHGLVTISQMISRWAPSPVTAPMDHNPTASYEEFVADACKVPETVPFCITIQANLEAMLHAMFHVENGGDYVSQQDLIAGVALALHT